MQQSIHGSRASYKRGCRCELCKQAEREYKKGLRQRQREQVGEFVSPGVTLSLVNGGSTGENSAPAFTGGPVESAVAEEIAGLGDHHRPGLAAGALAMARILDNPKAVSTQPTAVAQLMRLMDTLRKGSVGKKTVLAEVRQMTRSNAGSKGGVTHG